MIQLNNIYTGNCLDLFSNIPDGSIDLILTDPPYGTVVAGINFIETEESYTSGTSFLDSELPIKENYNKKRRVKRGLFKSNDGILINSDVNGALQIIKKVFPNVFAKGIKGCLTPKIINVVNFTIWFILNRY